MRLCSRLIVLSLTFPVGQSSANVTAYSDVIITNSNDGHSYVHKNLVVRKNEFSFNLQLRILWTDLSLSLVPWLLIHNRYLLYMDINPISAQQRR